MMPKVEGLANEPHNRNLRLALKLEFLTRVDNVFQKSILAY